MPYRIEKSGSNFNIVKKSTGEVVGTSSNRKDAEASARARMAGEHGWKPSKRKGGSK